MRIALLVLLLSFFSVSSAQSKMIGDFNSDGKINLQDVIAFVVHLSGRKSIPEIGFNIGDVIVKTVTDTLYLTADGQRAATEFLWGWWAAEWLTLGGIYAFLQDGTVYYDEYNYGRRVVNKSGAYKYDLLTGYISILWSDKTEWERPFDRYASGDSLIRVHAYKKVPAPPDWAR